MSLMAVALLLVLGGFLTISAAAKAVHPRAAAAALVELGLPRRAAQAAVVATVVAEGAVAVAIIVWPHSHVARAACLALFALFALVAALGLRSQRAIECGCFGALHRSTLGWTQVLQFALVVPGVVIVGRFAPAWSIQTGLELVFVLQVAAGALLFTRLSPVWWRIRRDRVSLASSRARARELAWPEAATSGGSAAVPR